MRPWREPGFILLLILSLNPWNSQAQTPRLITLKEAVQMSLEKSPGLISARNQMESSGLDQKNAFSGFLPSLDLAASHGLRGIKPDTTGLTAVTPWVSSAALSLTENFYDNGESFKKYRIASLQYELAKLNFHKIKAQIIRTVTLAYYRLNISAQNLKFTQKNHDELERLAKLVTNQFQQGMKTRKDFLSFKTRAQRGQLDVYQSEKAVITARGDLLSVLGLDPSETVHFDETQKPILAKNSFAVEIDPSSLYEVQALDLQRHISELQVDLSKRRFWPELDLVGGVSYGSADYINTGRSFRDNEVTQWNVLLNLKFNLIDWGVRNRNIQITHLAQDSLEQGLRGSLYLAERDLEIFKNDIARSAEAYRLSKELQKMEEDTFKLLESDYRSGRASYLELTTGLANLLDAQARGQEADFDQADLYLRWKYYKGNLDETTVFQ